MPQVEINRYLFYVSKINSKLNGKWITPLYGKNNFKYCQSLPLDFSFSWKIPPYPMILHEVLKKAQPRIHFLYYISISPSPYRPTGLRRTTSLHCTTLPNKDFLLSSCLNSEFSFRRKVQSVECTHENHCQHVIGYDSFLIREVWVTIKLDTILRIFTWGAYIEIHTGNFNGLERFVCM